MPWGRRPTPCRPVPGLPREDVEESASWWGQDWHASLRVGQAQGGVVEGECGKEEVKAVGCLVLRLSLSEPRALPNGGPQR